jgi:hypothetical protein
LPLLSGLCCAASGTPTRRRSHLAVSQSKPATWSLARALQRYPRRRGGVEMAVTRGRRCAAANLRRSRATWPRPCHSTPVTTSNILTEALVACAASGGASSVRGVVSPSSSRRRLAVVVSSSSRRRRLVVVSLSSSRSGCTGLHAALGANACSRSCCRLPLALPSPAVSTGVGLRERLANGIAHQKEKSESGLCVVAEAHRTGLQSSSRVDDVRGPDQ